MTTLAQRPCYTCGHQRQKHQPQCTVEYCPCDRFSSGMRTSGPNTVKLDKLIDQAILELSGAFESDDEIEKEMHRMVKRAMQRRQQ